MSLLWRIFYLAAMAAVIRASNGGTVEGIVVNSITGEGLAGVKVEVTPADNKTLKFRMVTGPSGEFRFSAPEPRQYTFLFDKDGFESPDPEDSATVYIPAQGSVTLRRELDPLTTIRGKVLDDQNSGIKRIPVELLSGRGQIRMTVNTDSSGAFSISESASGRLFPANHAESPPWLTWCRSLTVATCQSVRRALPKITF